MRDKFENSGRLVRFMLRRERVVSVIWIVCLVLFSAFLSTGMGSAFDDASRQALAATLNNPAMVAMMGPVYGIDNYTIGAMYSNCMLLWIIIAVAIMNIFLVVRHTRGDEEKGRAEVARSLPTGRLSIINATMITALCVNAVLSVLTGVLIAAVGDSSMSFGGAMLYGLTMFSSGMFFAAVTALFSQLSSNSRGASGYSILVLVLLYMLRAVGDIRSEALALISPMGLILRSQVFVENNVLPSIIVFIEAVVVAAVAYKLNSIRDIEQGFISARPGRRGASSLLSSSFGLSFRLLRNTIIIWFVGMLLLGASYGTVLGDVDDFIQQNEFYQAMIGANAEYSTAMMFSTMVNSIMALVCLVPILTSILKPLGEEREGRAEHILARAVSRSKYIIGYIIIAVILAALIQFATAAGLYSAASAVLPDPAELSLGFLLKANLVFLPAIWFFLSVAVVFAGFAPRATGAIWGYFGFCFLMSFVGRVMDMPAVLAKLNPFDYIPQLPVDEIKWAPLIVMTIAAAALTIAGATGYSRRSLKSM